MPMSNSNEQIFPKQVLNNHSKVTYDKIEGSARLAKVKVYPKPLISQSKFSSLKLSRIQMNYENNG